MHWKTHKAHCKTIQFNKSSSSTAECSSSTPKHGYLAYPDSVSFTPKQATDSKNLLLLLSDRSKPPTDRMQPLGELCFDDHTFVAAAERQSPSLWAVAVEIFVEEAELFESRMMDESCEAISMTHFLLSCLLSGETGKGLHVSVSEARSAALFAVPGALSALLRVMETTIRTSFNIPNPGLKAMLNHVAREQLHWTTMALVFESVGRSIFAGIDVANDLDRYSVTDDIILGLRRLCCLSEEHFPLAGTCAFPIGLAIEGHVHLLVALIAHWDEESRTKVHGTVRASAIGDQMNMSVVARGSYQRTTMPVALASIQKKRILTGREANMEVLHSIDKSSRDSHTGTKKKSKSKSKGKKSRARA
jgi:hypothetical protein